MSNARADKILAEVFDRTGNLGIQDVLLPGLRPKQQLSHGGGDYGPSPYEPLPEGHTPGYTSPHSLDYVNEKPIKTPVFDYVEDETGHQQAFHTGTSYRYPHRDWIKAREAFATANGDPENDAIRLQAVLDCVTETNPPPGPPIPVYKPVTRKEVGVRPSLVFALLWVLIGLAPMLVYIFMAIL